MIHVYQQAEPFFLQGSNQTALLFLHGFTASPSEVYPVAKRINQQTDTAVSGVLLPGHGSHPRFLNRTTWENWYATVEDECSFLLENYENVYVAGLSMGGLLAMYAGLHIKGLKGVVSINAPIYNRYPVLTALAPVIQVIKPYFPKKNDERARKLWRQGRFSYDCNPVKAFRSMLKLRKAVMEEIKDLNIPILVIQSLKDESVKPQSADFIYKQVDKNYIKKLELTESGHIATMGEERAVIARAVIEFIGKN